MESLLKKHDWLRQIPFLLLAISCGISSGKLMGIAVLLYLVCCYYEKTPVLGPLAKSHLFRQSLFFLAIFFGCSFITIPFNGGNISQLFKYVERILPMVLVAMMIKPCNLTFRISWYGMLISLLVILLSVAQYPRWEGHRLFGPFSSPNTLGGLIIVLLPVIMFGIIRYRRNFPQQVLIATILAAAAIVVMLCTGSRNAYITFAITFFLLLWFVYRYHDIVSLRVMGAMTLVAVIAVGCMAPVILTQRLNRNLQSDGRVYLMQSGLQIATEHPLVGIGVGNWGRVYKQRFEADNPNHEKNIQSPHNVYLHILNETGLVGLSGFLILMVYQLSLLYKSICQAYKKNRQAFPWIIGFGLSILSIYLFGLLDYDYFSRHMMHLNWFIWGMCLYAAMVIEKEY